MTPEQWYKIIYQKAVSLLEEEKNIYWGEKKQSERIKEQMCRNTTHTTNTTNTR